MLIIIIKVKDTIVLIFDSHKLNVVILEGPGSSLSKNLKIELNCNSLSDGVTRLHCSCSFDVCPSEN